MAKRWISLGVTPSELRVAMTLTNGQCFGWKRVKKEANEWVGVVGETVVGLRDRVRGVEFCTHNTITNKKNGMDIKSLTKDLRSYFQLDVSMEKLCSEWSTVSHGDFAKISSIVEGMRVVRQDPTECLFSFICSSNNNIGRITLMLDRLRSSYGTNILESTELGSFYTFPTPDKLARISEQELRDLGFGYRAKFVVRTAEKLQGLGGDRYLQGLRGHSIDSIRKSLMAFDGVGPKVADCVALFSLDASGTVPVDTHVWSIACRDFDDDGTLKAAKSVTPKIYDLVGERFRERFGAYAGWAHSIMFAAELPLYRPLLPPDIRDRIVRFAKYEKEMKLKRRNEKKERKMLRDKVQENNNKEGGTYDCRDFPSATTIGVVARRQKKRAAKNLATARQNTRQKRRTRATQNT